VKIDISNLPEVDKFFLNLKTDNIEIEHLYNNAGKGFFGNVEKLTEEDIDSVFGSNLIGLVNMTSRVITHMKNFKQKCRIINILSTASLVGKKNETIYIMLLNGEQKGFLNQ
jgi:short-subunit dehydrogenase